ncbi:MAG: ABC transporter ATP-binding protein [Desulfobacteraceae bacterium]|nr:ABC transporter ATP-binding protein [Desulfobacteraceae bacterium]
MNTAPIIETQNITKKYGTITAVKELNLKIPQGVCFGLLGPNGAGKTTLIEMIEGIISPTAGNVLYFGKSRKGTFREQIGIMFQQTSLLNYMTVRETLETFKSLYHKSLPIESLMQLCHLNEIRDQYNDKISGGQRQRLLLALALVNQPKLIFLDEPSTGLDPQARRNLWEIITKIKKQGKTIILTTHYMEEAQELCDQIAIMEQGQIIAKGTPDDLIVNYTKGVMLNLPKKCLPSDFYNSDFYNNNKEKVSIVNGRAVFQAPDLNYTISNLISSGADLSQLNIHTPNLETVFLNLTGRRLRD